MAEVAELRRKSLAPSSAPAASPFRLASRGGLRSQALIGPAAAASGHARYLGRAPALVGGIPRSLARRLGALAFLPRGAHRHRARPLPSLPCVPGGLLMLGRPQAVGFPGRRWELGGRRGSRRHDWSSGPSTSPASAAPASGKGCFCAQEPSLGWKAERRKAGSLTLSPCEWGWVQGTSREVSPGVEPIHRGA